MTLAETLAARLGADAAAEEAFGIVTVDVPVAGWVQAAGTLRDDPELAFGWFDFLTAYDDVEQGFAVVVHVWSTAHHQQVVLRTHVARDDARLPTLTGVWRGANWHERETFEMFGIVFEGHPNLVPLLLPDGFEGHPLRKDFVLASRAMKEWPGAKEPGESHGDAPARRRMRPPGQPDPDEWGPDALPAAERAPTVTAPEEPS